MNRQGPRVCVCAVMTCFNRRDTTLACLRALAASECLGRVRLRAVLVDDASSDGTADAVAREFPWVDVYRSDGDLYWCRGMRLAYERALEKGGDHYLWLNDDTLLRPDALGVLLDCQIERQARTTAPVIVVGSTVDPVTGVRTYGGERILSRLRRLRVEPVEPGDRAQACDTMNGNIVLIPADAARRVGELNPAFEHAMGDTDYGLRARRLGIELWVAPRVQGTCSNNSTAGTHHDEDLPWRARWRRMLGRKGLPWRSWMTFTRGHTGALWPLYFAWPYARLLVAATRSGIRRRLGRQGALR